MVIYISCFLVLSFCSPVCSFSVLLSFYHSIILTTSPYTVTCQVSMGQCLVVQLYFTTVLPSHLMIRHSPFRSHTILRRQNPNMTYISKSYLRPNQPKNWVHYRPLTIDHILPNKVFDHPLTILLLSLCK